MIFDNIEVLRFNSQRDYTIGCLSFVRSISLPSVRSVELYPTIKKFQCFTLEDEYRVRKIQKETRIPAGNYKLGLRTEGPLHQKYLRRFPEMHQGMIHILDVPNFKYIYIHTGNDDEDTEGCVLVGDSVKGGYVSNSVITYRKIYPPIVENILKQPIYINIIDHDTPEAQ